MALFGLRQLAEACRKSDFKWRYIDNFWPTLEYRFKGNQIAGEGARVIEDLKRDGVSITSVSALLGKDSCYEELCGTVDSLEQESAEQIAAERAIADDVIIGRKTFVYRLLGEPPKFDPNSIYARSALQKPLLQVANAYLGMYTVLRDYNVWRTFPTQVEPRESQLWHRDRIDRWVLKVFVYLSDVDDSAGPFTYALGTHSKGNVRREPSHVTEGHGIRTLDSQMSEVVPPQQWRKCLGPKGTIIVADTHGYHKGGHVRGRDRLMYLCMFNSPACPFSNLSGHSLDMEQALALAGPKTATNVLPAK
jgi:hypothetical protein